MRREGMRIGVDFDGVISDPSAIKIRLAKEQYGVKLTPEYCTTSRAAPLLNPNGKEKYTKLYKSIEASPISLDCKLVGNVKRALKLLKKAGHEILIITTLDRANYRFAKKFLRKNRVSYNHVICVPINRRDPELKKYTKKYLIERFKVGAMVDVSYYNLEPLSGSGVKLFLMHQPWNKHIRIKHHDIIRADWHKVYEELKNV